MAVEMKNSGVQWIGKIPKNWSINRVSRLFDIQLGKMLQPNPTSGLDVLVDYLCAANVGGNRLKLDVFKQMWMSPLEKKQYLVKKGDLLVVEGGDVASCTIVNDIPEGICIQNALHRVRSRGNAVLRYLMYLIQTAKFSGKIDQICNKATIAHFTKEKLARLEFVEPPLQEQEAIANFLDEKCAEIDGLLADLEEQIKTLRAYEKSLIYEAVAHGMDSSATMKETGLGWLDKIPSHWEISRIANVYSLRNEKVSDKDFAPLSVTMRGIVPQLESAAKTKHGDDRKLIRKGDFVINSRSDRRGSCGISEYDGSCSLINIVLKPREEMHPKYYNWLFHTPLFADEFYKWGYGIVDDLWTTNWGAMRRIQIPVPPMEEQIAIATYLDDKVARIEELIGDKFLQTLHLKEYKSSLIYEYVTGKKQVAL